MNPKQYALICFLILMDDYSTKDIRYMDEKLAMLNDGLNAFGWLDYHNMEKVLMYLKKWKYEIPEVWQKEYDMQIAVANNLGFEL